MNSSQWKDTAELLGIGAIVASLIFVGMQLKLDRDMALADAITDQNQSYQYWAELVNSNPDVWQKGLSGAQLTDVETLRFKSLASANEMLYVSAFERSRFIGGNPPTRYATQWALQIYRNPGLKNHWEDSRRTLDIVRELSNYEKETALPDDAVWEKAVNEQLRKIENQNRK